MLAALAICWGTLPSCSPSEATSCPVDCNAQVSAFFACAELKCPTDATTCFADVACAASINCMILCDKDQTCANKCTDPLTSAEVTTRQTTLECVD